MTTSALASRPDRTPERVIAGRLVCGQTPWRDHATNQRAGNFLYWHNTATFQAIGDTTEHDGFGYHGVSQSSWRFDVPQSVARGKCGITFLLLYNEHYAIGFQLHIRLGARGIDKVVMAITVGSSGRAAIRRAV